MIIGVSCGFGLIALLMARKWIMRLCRKRRTRRTARHPKPRGGEQEQELKSTPETVESSDDESVRG
jgi:hypothetical protein